MAGSGGAVLYGHTAIQSQDLALSKRALRDGEVNDGK
jgi:hypothetical protein